MCPALPLAQIASDSWKSAAFDAVAFAYRIAHSIRIARGAATVSRVLWKLDGQIKEIQKVFYSPKPEEPTAPPSREKLQETVGAVRALYAGFQSLEASLKAGGFLNQSKIAAPIASIVERLEDLVDFAEVVELLIQPDVRREADAIFERTLGEFNRGETVALDSII